MNGPFAALLPDGRLHLQHGPIDLVIEAAGRDIAHSSMSGMDLPAGAVLHNLAQPSHAGVEAAYRRAALRFRSILPELVAELPRLRMRCPPEGLGLAGRVARRMQAAVWPFAAEFITPMAAVAGAVADEVAEAMTAEGDLTRALVNNGGDIALQLAEGEAATIGIVVDPRSGLLAGRFRIVAGQGIFGVATSGRHGRSFSLGVADAVSVLAASGAAADAAATIIANAVDLPGCHKVTRRPARELSPDSDLGAIPVTVDVATLSAHEIGAALDRGEARAEAVIASGLASACVLALDRSIRIVGDLKFLDLPPTNRLAAAGLSRAT